MLGNGFSGLAGSVAQSLKLFAGQTQAENRVASVSCCLRRPSPFLHGIIVGHKIGIVNPPKLALVVGYKFLDIPQVKAHRSALAQTDARELTGAHLAANRHLAHAQEPRYLVNSNQRSHTLSAFPCCPTVYGLGHFLGHSRFSLSSCVA